MIYTSLLLLYVICAFIYYDRNSICNFKMKKVQIGTSVSLMDLLVIVLSIYVIIIFAVEELLKLPPQISDLLTYIDDFICAIFIFDFFHRLYLAENKWEFLKWGWIDLISSIPAFPLMRIGRALRLFRLIRIFRSVKILISHVFQNRIKGALKSAFTIAVLIVIVCSIGILIVEKDPHSTIKTAFDALYWSLSSLITGYTGMSPVTMEGKMIQLVLMFTGIALIGTFTAYVASWFIEEDAKNKNK